MFPLSHRNFGDAIAVHGLSWIHVWNFVRCSPSPYQNPGAAPVHLISIHISTVICTLSKKNQTLSLFQNSGKITATYTKFLNQTKRTTTKYSAKNDWRYTYMGVASIGTKGCLAPPVFFFEDSYIFT